MIHPGLCVCFQRKKSSVRLVILPISEPSFLTVPVVASNPSLSTCGPWEGCSLGCSVLLYVVDGAALLLCSPCQCVWLTAGYYELLRTQEVTEVSGPSLVLCESHRLLPLFLYSFSPTRPRGSSCQAWKQACHTLACKSLGFSCSCFLGFKPFERLTEEVNLLTVTVISR